MGIKKNKKHRKIKIKISKRRYHISLSHMPPGREIDREITKRFDLGYHRKVNISLGWRISCSNTGIQMCRRTQEQTRKEKEKKNSVV